MILSLPWDSPGQLRCDRAWGLLGYNEFKAAVQTPFMALRILLLLKEKHVGATGLKWAFVLRKVSLFTREE